MIQQSVAEKFGERAEIIETMKTNDDVCIWVMGCQLPREIHRIKDGGVVEMVVTSYYEAGVKGVVSIGGKYFIHFSDYLHPTTPGLDFLEHAIFRSSPIVSLKIDILSNS